MDPISETLTPPGWEPPDAFLSFAFSPFEADRPSLRNPPQILTVARIMGENLTKNTFQLKSTVCNKASQNSH